MRFGKRLKVGTFKVQREGVGIGRELLKLVYQYALDEQVDEIYLTVHHKSSKHRKFISFIEKNGFQLYGCKQKELVFVKEVEGVLFPEPLSHPAGVFKNVTAYR